MRLRPLEPRDAGAMLSWMHDPEAAGLLSADFAAKTLEDCRAFIASAARPGPALHWAVADDRDDYMGTVSLKAVDPARGTAEFAIATRREAWGRGFAAFAIRETLCFAFGNLGLNTVYWYVNRENARALRFYQKQGFAPLPAPPSVAPPALARDARMVWFLASAPLGEETHA